MRLCEAVAPELPKETERTPRYVLRTDVLVKRQEKPLGFAVSASEKEDYLACLNFFREGQQSELTEFGSWDAGELYERSLSIRYCYSRLLDSRIKEEEDKEAESICQRLPIEIWLKIFQYLNEPEIDSFIFAYPPYLSLKTIWQAAERKSFQTDSSRAKFIPTIAGQYGCQTLFRFSDVQFFEANIEECCRVAAVYAFFLLAHPKDSTTYTVRYNRQTHEVCEVERDQLFSDVFYNRNCYGVLYQVQQRNEQRRSPTTDLGHSVDRTYMTHRHQSQLIGQDLSARFYFTIKGQVGSDSDGFKPDPYTVHTNLLARQRAEVLFRSAHRFTDGYVDPESNTSPERIDDKDPSLGYSQNLIRQSEQEYGVSVCQLVSAKDLQVSSGPCTIHRDCPGEDGWRMADLTLVYQNHLVFDFDTHRLVVEQIPAFFFNSHGRVQPLNAVNPSTVYYRVNVAKLAMEAEGFDQAGCRSFGPDNIVDQLSFLNYTYLSYVNLAATRENDYVSVESMYGGIAAL